MKSFNFVKLNSIVNFEANETVFQIIKFRLADLSTNLSYKILLVVE